MRQKTNIRVTFTLIGYECLISSLQQYIKHAAHSERHVSDNTDSSKDKRDSAPNIASHQVQTTRHTYITTKLFH